MASSTSAHFQLLKKTTEVKLRELTKHERKLEEHYNALLQDMDFADALPNTTRRQQLAALHKGVKDLQVVQTNVHTELGGIDELVEFARADPWTTTHVLQQRTELILREVRQKRALWRHNKLLGALLMASLDEAEQAQTRKHTVVASPASESDDAAVAGDFVTVDDAGPLMGLTKDETQNRLESFFFHTDERVTEASVLAFLESHVFATRDAFSKEKTKRVDAALQSAKTAMQTFSETFLQTTVSDADVLECVRAMLREKSAFSDDIAKFLADVKSNAEMQKELAHVLTIQLSNLREFAWPASGVTVEIKRGMNGRFRCHLQEDALTALLFYYIGTSWGIQVKQVFTNLLNSLEDARQQHVAAASINEQRAAWVDRFRLAALPSSFASGGNSYDEDAAVGSAAADSEPKISKQDIVRLVCTEAHLAYQLQAPEAKASSRRGITAVTTDLEFFGPSVSHTAVFACLRFLGVTDDMLTIFRTYAQIPLVFPGYTAPRAMQRGLSVARMMTMFLSEVLLFVMDYHVLASTDVALFRKHDDIWFFDTDERKVLRAWREMNRVATEFGLRFNADKSGSQRITVNASVPDACAAPPMAVTAATTTTTPVLSATELPPQHIKWGLLVLQPNGTVRIAAELVTAFATEMADRLRAARSVLSWVNVYNKYMGFFLRNLGGASPVFGLNSVDAVLATLKDIHMRVFPETHGDVLAHVQAKIAANHPELVAAVDAANSDNVGVGDNAKLALPAAWVHWHMKLGGLGLFNPLLAVWTLKEPMFAHLRHHHLRAVAHWPKDKALWTWQQPFATVFAKDIREPYELFVELVETHGVEHANSTTELQRFLFLKSSSVSDERRWGARKEMGLKVDDSYTLRTFDEYLAVLPRVQMHKLVNEFKALLDEVEADKPTLCASHVAQRAAAAQLAAADIDDAYWHWVSFIYGDELLEAFGTVSFFSRELLPAQLIQTIKTTAVSF